LTDPVRAPAGDLDEAMMVADVRDTYNRLSQPHQKKFLAWIDKASDPDARERRIGIFVLSLRMGPLQPDGTSGTSSDLATGGG
jgi:hypothetical protein